MTQGEAVILNGCRTAIGKFQGSLASFRAPDLGAIVVREAVKRAGVQPTDVGECLMGCVLQAGLGQNPARQAALRGGLPPEVAATTVNKVCGSSLKTVMMAAQAVQLGDFDVVLAGGMESMSNAPYILPAMRGGARLGHAQAIDVMINDGLWDAYEDFHMGNTGEIVAKEFKVTRAETDAYAAESQRRAVAAIQSGAFRDEIVPVEIKQRKGPSTFFDTDEGPRADTTAEKLAALKPAFQPDGIVTAGNSSTINDGAAAVVVTTRAWAQARGLKPMARIVGYTTAGMEPKYVMVAPEKAVKALLQKVGWKNSDVDLYEINEAFAVQHVALRRMLELDPAKHNANGGGVALGHPIGASGSRCLVSLVYALRKKGLKRGVVSLCLGGGNAVAMAVEVEAL